MNDSHRKTKYVSLHKCSVAFGAIAMIAAGTGCANRDAFGSARTSDMATRTMFADSPVSQSETVPLNAVPSSEAPPPATPVVNASLISVAMSEMPMGPTLITLASDADLNQKIAEAPGAVVLDFYADWCGPCRTQGRILHEMEGAAARTKTTIIKINIEEHRDLAQQLNVSSLPTLMLVKNGRVTERQTGVATKQHLVTWMQ